MIKTQQAPTGTMTKAEARVLTDRIKNAVEDIRKLVAKAHDAKAWKPLGYATWEAYVKTEFGMSRSYAHRLIQQGEVIEAIESAAGNLSPMGNISEREARELKPVLADVTAEIKQRVEQGEKPDTAATEAIKSAREKSKAEREATRSKNEAASDETRAKYSAGVQAIMASKDQDEGLSDAERIAELEETVASLEKENAALKAENQKFSEMKVEYAKGGFAEVIAGKDEVIRSQKTRIESESQEKVKNLRSAEYWKREAINLGWSNDIVIDIETGEVVNG